MQRMRGCFVARRPSRLGQLQKPWQHPRCKLLRPRLPSIAAAGLPREGGAVKPRTAD